MISLDDSLRRDIKETGIVGLDKILNGGIPEGHVILVEGEAGTGKTILSMQWLFEGLKKYDDKGIYIAVTEPFMKAIRNIRNLDFFDQRSIEEGSIRFTDFRSMAKIMDFGEKSDDIDKEDIDELISNISDLIESIDAKRLVIDSITAIGYRIKDEELFRYFIFRLGTVLDTKGCTAFLTSESRHGESPFNIEDFISDGIITMEQISGEQSMIRKLSVRKMRGIDYRSGQVTFKIDSEGLTIFPKIPIERFITRTDFSKRKSTGLIRLDEMLDGGFPEGHVILLSGNTGTGKTTFAMKFLMQGLEEGEGCIFVNFEEPLTQVIKTAAAHGWDFQKYKENGLLKFVSPDLIDTYPDRFLYEVLDAIKGSEVKRIVIDSISSIISADINPDKLRELILQLNTTLKKHGINLVMTHLETGIFGGSYGSVIGQTKASDLRLSSLTDGIILLRYNEEGDSVGKVMNILKMRGSKHSKDIVEYKIDEQGIYIGEKLDRRS